MTRKLFLPALLLISSLTHLAAATLNVGDPAPKLQVAKWVQGDPVTAFERDKAYIVEFWATWCGPCITSIPHLNEIHEKYKSKGLVVIGQDCWENDESKVEPFIKKMGDKMTYRVALDDKNGSERGKMAETWMAAAGRNGIPSAFLVDKNGDLAWIGHPMELKDKTIQDVLAGTFDTKKAAAAYKIAKANEEKAAPHWREFSTAMRTKNWAAAEKALNELNAFANDEDKDRFDQYRLTVHMGLGNNESAEKIAARLADTQPDDYSFHNELAWAIAIGPNPSKNLLAIAEKEANKANTLAKGKHAPTLDTLARVQFMLGDKESAIANQQKAVDATSDPRQKANFEDVLKNYKAGKLSD